MGSHGSSQGEYNSLGAGVVYYRIRNVDYGTLDSIKIRLKDSSDSKSIVLNNGQYIEFTFGPGSDALGEIVLEYEHVAVQQVDFNDGKGSDDLTMPGYGDNDKDSVVYIYTASKHQQYNIINYAERTYLSSFTDDDGIDGGPKAYFTQKIVDDVLYLDISKTG